MDKNQTHYQRFSENQTTSPTISFKSLFTNKFVLLNFFFFSIIFLCNFFDIFIIMPLPPVINDIVTNPDAPLQYLNTDHTSQDYDPSFAAKQREAYPYIKPVVVTGEKQAVFGTLRDLAKNEFGWNEVQVNETTFTFQSVATTKIMRFKDDVVVHIEDGTDPNTCIVQMRSKSRIGKGDIVTRFILINMIEL